MPSRKKIAAHLDQAGRAGRLDHGPGAGADNTDCTVAVQVLMETGLERLQRTAVPDINGGL